MKPFLLILAVVLGVGCGELKEEKTAEVRAKSAADAKLIANPHLEKKIRKELKKPKGELTKEDLEKVEDIYYSRWHLTGIPKGLEKLTQLDGLDLEGNPDLTRAQIDELQKALPKCDIRSNPTE
jgi:hypothetical protein